MNGKIDMEQDLTVFYSRCGERVVLNLRVANCSCNAELEPGTICDSLRPSIDKVLAERFANNGVEK